MCGIAAFYPRKGRQVNLKKYVITSLVVLEDLGTDAAGVYNGTNRIITKRIGLPRRLIRDIRHQRFKGLALVHTRQATKGSPLLYKNTHPFYTRDWIGIHNGWLYNDDRLQRKYGLSRQGETDSEVIWRLADVIGIDKTIEKLEGSFRCIGLYIPLGELHVFGNDPIWYGKNKEVHIFTNYKKLLSGFRIYRRVKIIDYEHRIYGLRGGFELLARKKYPYRKFLYTPRWQEWEKWIFKEVR